MADRRILDLHPILPKLDTLDLDQITLNYDDMTDTLYVHLFGHARAAVSVEIDDGTFLRVDPETQEVVGLQIESALARESNDLPEIISLAELAAAPAEAIERARRRVSPAANKRAALRSLLNRPHVAGVGG